MSRKSLIRKRRRRMRFIILAILSFSIGSFFGSFLAWIHSVTGIERNLWIDIPILFICCLLLIPKVFKFVRDTLEAQDYPSLKGGHIK